MFRFVTALFKITLASLLAGAALSFLGITMETALAFIGQTPDGMIRLLNSLVAWALPNIALGAMVVVPAWLLTYLFLPPRDD